MAEFKFNCPQCKKEVISEESQKGKVIRCPHCEKGIVVPRDKPKPIIKKVAPIQVSCQEQDKSPLREIKLPHRRVVPVAGSISLANTEHAQGDVGDNTSPVTRPTVAIEDSPAHPLMGSKISFAATASVPLSPSVSNPVLAMWCAIAVVGIVAIVSMIVGAATSLRMAKKHQIAMECIRIVQEEVDQKIVKEDADLEAKIAEGIKALRVKSEKSKHERFDLMQDDLERLRVDFKHNMDDLAARIGQIEKLAKSFSSDRGSASDDRYRELVQRIEELTKQTGGIVARQKNLAARQDRLAEQQKDNIQERVEQRSDGPSPAEVSRRINANLAEINRLRAMNPACVLVKSHRQARILETRLASKADRQYTVKDKITYVRDMFHCTACKAEISLEDANRNCCEVSGKRSFALWRGARLDAEETARINARIDELRRENAIIRNGGQPPAVKTETTERPLPEAMTENQEDLSVGTQSQPTVEMRPNQSIADKRRQYTANLAEIKRLRESNPGCIIDPTSKQARVLEMRYATKAQQKYCSKEQITYVSSVFRCTSAKCKKVSSLRTTNPCCDVSRKQSFPKWREKVREAEETSKINARIDELLKENAALKMSMQQ